MTRAVGLAGADYFYLSHDRSMRLLASRALSCGRGLVLVWAVYGSGR